MEDSLKNFISAHVVKGEINDIVYTGELSLIGKTLDGAIAELRHNTSDKQIKQETISLGLYGENIVITLPVFSDLQENYKDVSQLYRNTISDYLKIGIFSDRRGAVLFKLLDKFGVAIQDDVCCFFPKDGEDINIIESIVKRDVVNIGEVSIELDISSIEDIKRYENVMLLFKEVASGYYDVRRHSIVDKSQGQYIQQEYCMGQDVIVMLNTTTKEVISVTQHETKYDGFKDKGSWVIKTPTGEIVNTKDFVPYKTTVDGDITTIEMYGAYTHILREALDFKPLTRQYKLLLNFNRLNFVAGCRRSGKTYVSAYIILRELWKMPNSIRHINRQVRGLYIAPTEDKFKEVIDYIKKSSEKMRVLKVIDFNKKENRLSLFDEKVSRNQKTLVTVATCDFSSAKGYEPGRGRASDMVVIDEAAFVVEDVRLNILPILENEKASLFAISTIDWKTHRNRFYGQLVEAEKGLDDELHAPMYGLRVTIDDIDDVLVDDGMRARMKNALQHDRGRYYAELYASLPEVGNVFQTEGFFTLDANRQTYEQVQGYLIGYDPAKRTDIGAIIVGEMRVSSSGEEYCSLIEEYELKGEYTEQHRSLLAIKNKYSQTMLPTYVVIDATQVGDAVAEIMGNTIDYKVWYTSKGKRPEVDNYGAWKVPKTHLVHLCQIFMEKSKLKARIGLKNLMDEIKNFKAITTPSGNVKYEAEVGHDDHVNAMMLITFYLGFIQGLAYELGYEGGGFVMEGVNPATNLYESYAQRGPVDLGGMLGVPGMKFGV